MGGLESMAITPSPVSPSRFLIATRGGRYLAFDAESVCGVMPCEASGNVEEPTIQGLTYGDVNLSDRLGLPNDHNGADTHVLLLSDRETRGSIRVTTVEGILELEPSQLLPLPMQFRGPERDWYRGIILFANSIAVVLHTRWVLNGQAAAMESGGKEEQTSCLLTTPSERSATKSRMC